jgi:hypothetical protein
MLYYYSLMVCSNYYITTLLESHCLPRGTRRPAGLQVRQPLHHFLRLVTL